MFSEEIIDSGPSGDVQRAFLIAEYSALKMEQIERIKLRDGFTYLAILSIGAIASFGLGSSGEQTVVLLSIPWVLLSLGWAFVLNDVKVARIATYLEQHLAASGLDSWERWRVNHHWSSLETQRAGLMVQGVIFGLPGVVACVAFVVQRQIDRIAVGEWLLLVGALGLTLWLFAAFWSAAKLRRR